MLLLAIVGCVVVSLLLGVLPLAAWLLIAKAPRELDWSHACLPGHAHNPIPRDTESRDGWCTFCHARYVERAPLVAASLEVHDTHGEVSRHVDVKSGWRM